MDNSSVSPPKRPKRTIWIGAGVVVLCFLVYIAFHGWPPVDNATGTIGAAKKYRSEQITDKDVKLADQGTVAEASVKDPADEGMATELKNSAAALGKTAEALAARQSFDRTTVLSLKQTSAELASAAAAVLNRQTVLEKSEMADLQRQVTELNSRAMESLQNKTSLDRQAYESLEKNAALVQARAIAMQPALESRAQGDFQAAARSLQMYAKAIEARPSYDRQQVARLQNAAAALERSAQVVARQAGISRQATIDMMMQARAINLRASDALALKAPLSKFAAHEMGERALLLQKQAADYESRAALGQRAPAEGQ